MSGYLAESIPRYDGRDEADLFAWDDVVARLTRIGWSWLSTIRADGGPHLVPVFAAFDAETTFLLVATNARTQKARNLRRDDRCVVARDAEDVHLVVEGIAHPVRDLHRASALFASNLRWPTTVTQDGLDAPYGSPTSLGPPYQAWTIHATKIFAFPTDVASFAPTRFTHLGEDDDVRAVEEV